MLSTRFNIICKCCTIRKDLNVDESINYITDAIQRMDEVEKDSLVQYAIQYGYPEIICAVKEQQYERMNVLFSDIDFVDDAIRSMMNFKLYDLLSSMIDLHISENLFKILYSYDVYSIMSDMSRIFCNYFANSITFDLIDLRMHIITFDIADECGASDIVKYITNLWKLRGSFYSQLIAMVRKCMLRDIYELAIKFKRVRIIYCIGSLINRNEVELFEISKRMIRNCNAFECARTYGLYILSKHIMKYGYYTNIDELQYCIILNYDGSNEGFEYAFKRDLSLRLDLYKVSQDPIMIEMARIFGDYQFLTEVRSTHQIM